MEKTPYDRPASFGEALVGNAEALMRFEAMTEEEKRKTLMEARALHTPEEYRRYVDSMVGWQEGHGPYQL